MKLSDLYEMPIKTTDERDRSDRYINRWKDALVKAPPIGEIEDEFQLRRHDNVWGIFDSDELVASVTVTNVSDHEVKVDNLWVKKEREGQKILSKFLWYLHSRENKSKIVLGNTHSTDTIRLLAAGGFRHFKKSWVNNITGKSVKFDPTTMAKYYTGQEWQLIFENYDDTFTGCSRFSNMSEGFMKPSFGFIEPFDDRIFELGTET